MSETNEQEESTESLPATAEPSLKFQLPEMKDVDIFVLQDEDGERIVRTAAELEEAGLWPGSEPAAEE